MTTTQLSVANSQEWLEKYNLWKVKKHVVKQYNSKGPLYKQNLAN
jgi:hypothetical protein